MQLVSAITGQGMMRWEMITTVHFINKCSKNEPKGHMHTVRPSSILELPDIVRPEFIMDCILRFLSSWYDHNTNCTPNGYTKELDPVQQIGIR